MDRITLNGLSAFKASEGVEYLENNCIEEPTKLCEFKHVHGRILKTVDAVHQDVNTLDECRELCLNSPFKCRSYDYGDTGEMVCRLSHHGRSTLSDVEEPYLEVPEATTHELAACYNVSIECHSKDMVARIRTSKLFDGKVYAKGSPNSCSIDVKNSLDFELRMAYQDIECNVRQNGLGRYLNDVVIQHHDMIVTSSDLGLALTCQYDLTNKTVSNDVDLGVNGEIEPALSEEVIVDSPTVVMRITARDGAEMRSVAEVGDALALNFQIVDKDSPFEILVRELVAMDGADSGEITLIDSRGCPTDSFIMGPILKTPNNGKILISHFDAFKFPSSDTVQFRALVTPCMPTCEPVQCDNEEFNGGELRSIISYGRKRRSVNNTEINSRKRRKVDEKVNMHEDMLLVQTIHINDKFGFANKQKQDKPTDTSNNSETIFFASEAQSFCVNGLGKGIEIGFFFLFYSFLIHSFFNLFFSHSGVILTGTVFLLAQLVVIALWMNYTKDKRLNSTLASASSAGSSIYDRNYAAFR
jgi:PAN domain